MKTINSNRVQIICFLILIFCMMTVICYLFFSFPHTAYINNTRVFEEFHYKKELEKKFDAIRNTRKNLLDSLALRTELMSEKIKSKKQVSEELYLEFENMKKEYYLKKQQFDEDNNTLLNKYDNEIWMQLNQYIKEYGDLNNYKYIFGTAGLGTLMYAKESEDITDEVIEFVNKKYEGE
ncbi:MAG: OmpH family outer membrane protein [Bacteroidia bacterium]|nr:OmpH family outer membrane protein [Bacteroidia bacterium]